MKHFAPNPATNHECRTAIPHPMPPFPLTIKNLISTKWNHITNAANIIRTTNFANEGKIDFSIVLTDCALSE